MDTDKPLTQQQERVISLLAKGSSLYRYSDTKNAILEDKFGREHRVMNITLLDLEVHGVLISSQDYDKKTTRWKLTPEGMAKATAILAKASKYHNAHRGPRQ